MQIIAATALTIGLVLLVALTGAAVFYKGFEIISETKSARQILHEKEILCTDLGVSVSQCYKIFNPKS